MLEEEALRISEIFKTNFFVQPLPFDLRHKEFVMCLPPSADLVRDVKVKNKLETNSVIEVTQKQLGYVLVFLANDCSILLMSSFFFLYFFFQLYFQIEPEEGTTLTKLKALTDLFDEIVEEPLFNQLRYVKFD